MINGLKNYEKITIKLFGKDTLVNVICVGKRKYKENENQENFYLNSEELDILNWFINNIKIEDYEKEILDYCNKEYSKWSDKQINLEDIKNEINIDSIIIYINSYDNKAVYPDISFCGNCECDSEHGICIRFADKKFIGIAGVDWIL